MVAPGDGDCRPMVKGARKCFLCTLFHLLNFKVREETVQNLKILNMTLAAG